MTEDVQGVLVVTHNVNAFILNALQATSTYFTILVLCPLLISMHSLSFKLNLLRLSDN